MSVSQQPSLRSLNSFKCPACGRDMKIIPQIDSWICPSGWQISTEFLEDIDASIFIKSAFEAHNHINNERNLYEWIIRNINLKR